MILVIFPEVPQVRKKFPNLEADEDIATISFEVSLDFVACNTYKI